MKKLTFIFTMIMALAAYAQTDKSSIYLGAKSNLNFSSQNVKGGSDGSNINLSGTAGMFLIDNFLLNLTAGFQKDKLGSVSDRNIEIGPGLRYYFNNIFIGAA